MRCWECCLRRENELYYFAKIFGRYRNGRGNDKRNQLKGQPLTRRKGVPVLAEGQVFKRASRAALILETSARKANTRRPPTMKARTTDAPRIYVACLAAYNAGILHGAWIDATLELDDIWIGIQKLIDSSPSEDAQEWALHDFDNFGALRLGESESIERVHEIALFIEEHEDLGCKLIAHFCGDLNAARNALENYYGEYDSLADYARELT